MAKKAKEPESVAGYFRPIFQENPGLLISRSNDELLQRWLKDHPGEKEVPAKVKQNLANLKSVLRKKARKRGRKAPAAVAGVQPTPVKKQTRSLEALEIQIDDCLSTARSMDREGLESVISHLRRARNEVVWKTGQ
jgi:hypothetical protein